MKKLSSSKQDQLTALETPCADLISKCLIVILSTKTNSGDDSHLQLNKNILGERIENNFENTGTNKRARLMEPEWSWQRITEELKDEKTAAKQAAWFLIIESLVSSDSAIPEVYFVQMFDFLAGQIKEIHLNSATNETKRKTLSISKSIDSHSFQLFHFRLFYVFVKKDKLNLRNKIKEVATKTALFFLRNINKDGKCCAILSDLLEFDTQLDPSIYKVNSRIYLQVLFKTLIMFLFVSFSLISSVVF